MPFCNGTDRSSNFALTRKGADFHWVRDNEKGMISLIVRRANVSTHKVRCAPDPVWERHHTEYC